MTQINVPQGNENDIFSFGFDKGLNRVVQNSSTPSVYDSIEDRLAGTNLSLGALMAGTANTAIVADPTQGLWLGNEKFSSAPFRVNMAGEIFVKDLTIANRVIGVSTSSELTAAIASLTATGTGGEIRLAAGTYTVTAAQALPSSIRFVGDNASTTTIVFTGSANFTMTGGSVYTTGTLTVNQGSTSVAGSGTTWTSAMIGQQIFLSKRWYLISAVGGSTSLTLATSYADANLAGATYRISSVIKDVEFDELTIVGASGTKVIDGIDVRDITFENIIIATSGASGMGIELDNLMSVESHNLTISGVTGVTTHGLSFTQGSFVNQRQTACVSNGGSGTVWNNIKTSSIIFSAGDANTADGYNFTSVTDSFFIVEAAGNGSQGIELVSGCNNNRIFANATSNTSDGIKLTATDDTNLIVDGYIASNGGYGVNIVASTCDNNNITANVFASNVTAAANDAGTGTVIRGNVGLNDNTASSSSISAFVGDGSDGDATISSNTTLTTDKYYDNLTVNNGFALHMAGYRVFVKGTLTNAGTIDRNGTTGGNGGNASGVTAGTAGTGATGLAAGFLPGTGAGSNGGIGGTGNGGAAGAGANGANTSNSAGTSGNAGTAGVAGGNSSSSGGAGGGAGSAGTATAPTGGIPKTPVELIVFREYVSATPTAMTGSAGTGGGGGGGGGGSGGAGNGGGGGGAGGSGTPGGIGLISANTIVNTGTISCNGGTGGTGGNGADGTSDSAGGSGGRGGSGGTGGVLALLYASLTDSGTISATGGSGGSGGNAGGGTGPAGNAGGTGASGAAGRVIKIQV